MKAMVTAKPGSTRFVYPVLVSPWFIVALAFALRLENILAHHLYLIPANQDHAFFGFEMGRLARSIASGKGFSQVFDASSESTAWWTPVFPLLLGGIFKIFGIYSAKSALVILTLNSLFSALTCATIFFIAKETLGRMTAVWSAWAWALLPYAIYWPTHHIWETSLTALLVTIAILCTLRMVDSQSFLRWAAFGALWGFIALSNAVLLSFLPVALFWIGRNHPRGLAKSFQLLALFAAAVLLVIAPWIFRNEIVMGRFIFPRSNLGFELYMGNHGEGYSRGSFRGPFWNEVERNKYEMLGELPYMSDKLKLATAFIAQHPGTFVRFSMERAVFFWITSPDEYWLMRGRNFLRMSLLAVLDLTGLAGLYLAFKNRVRGTLLFAGVLFFYPLVYYVTHVESRYSHPLAPLVLMLVIYAISEFYGRYQHSDLKPRLL
jgi:4-amino-4-deoxy-L-arabinose transferase-like glycosyltransferase